MKLVEICRKFINVRAKYSSNALGDKGHLCLTMMSKMTSSWSNKCRRHVYHGFHKHELRMTHIMNSCMTLVFKQWYLSPTQLDMYMTSPWSPMCFHFFSSLWKNSKKIFCNRHSKIRDDNQQIFVG